MNYLELTIDGIAQHWSSKKDLVTAVSSAYYATEKCPTKSGIVGMMGAALGYPYCDERLTELFESTDIRYRMIHKGIVAVDFQVARPLDGDAFETVGGKHKDDGVIKRVEYLQDYAFVVYVGADDKRLQEIYEAFQCPKWQPYFGKKCCLPGKPIVREYKVVSKQELEDMKNVYDCP